MQMETIYLPELNSIFEAQAPSMEELAPCLALSSVVFFAVEAEKWLVRRGSLYRTS